MQDDLEAAGPLRRRWQVEPDAGARSCCLARPMRLAMVASGTRNARAISAVVSPPTARSVSASWEGTGSTGWQHISSRARESSCPGGAWSDGSRAATAASRRRRARTLRHSSTTARLAAVTSHDRGLLGTPSVGQCFAAATRASWTASSQTAKSS